MANGLTTITCQVPEYMSAKIKEVAKKKGISKSDIIRIAINEYMQRNQKE